MMRKHMIAMEYTSNSHPPSHPTRVPQIMSVNPGFGGQKFIEYQVGKIAKLKQMCNELGVNPWIEVDGGVTPANAYKLIEVSPSALCHCASIQ